MIHKLLFIEAPVIHPINLSTPWTILLSIGYWLGIAGILFIIVMIIWNMVDAIRGKEEPSPEAKEINELRSEISKLRATISKQKRRSR